MTIYSTIGIMCILTPMNLSLKLSVPSIVTMLHWHTDGNLLPSRLLILPTCKRCDACNTHSKHVLNILGLRKGHVLLLFFTCWPETFHGKDKIRTFFRWKLHLYSHVSCPILPILTWHYDFRHGDAAPVKRSLRTWWRVVSHWPTVAGKCGALSSVCAILSSFCPLTCNQNLVCPHGTRLDAKGGIHMCQTLF